MTSATGNGAAAHTGRNGAGSLGRVGLGTVDFRRFRTWDAEPAVAATPAWRILAKYGYIRLLSSWPGRTLLIILTLVAVLAVGGSSYEFASAGGVSAAMWSGVLAVYLYPLGAILLLVAAPLFADDLRFNAPLFYFSKPLRVGDYFAGKLAFLGSLIGAAVLVPILAFLILALTVGVPVGDYPEYFYRTGYSASDIARMEAEWEATHVDSAAEWAAATAATLPGMLVAIALFTSLAVACSVFTRRGWHAGMAFVAVVAGTGIAGAVLSDSVEGAMGHLASPLGWSYLMVQMPMELMFQHPGSSYYYEVHLRDAGLAIPLAYALAVATTVAVLWACQMRLKTQEARL